MKDLIEKYLNEYDTSYGDDRGKTTKDKGHSHDFFVDRITGDGTTSHDSGHFHKIKAMVVQSANRHTHGLK